MPVELTAEQTAELKRLKAYFPYRIVFGVIDKDTGAFEAWANSTMRIANQRARAGHHVFVWGADARG